MRKRRTKKEAIELQHKIRKLAQNGFTYKEISEMLGLNSPQIVAYYFHLSTVRIASRLK